MDFKKSRLATLLAFILAVFSLYSSSYSLLDGNIYHNAIETGVFSAKLLPGDISQNLVNIPASVLLAVLAIRFLRRLEMKNFIAILGLTMYFFYAFGLLAISGTFTSLYFIYLVIFGFSVYSLIYGFSAFRMNELSRELLPGYLRGRIAYYLILVVLVFSVIWFPQLIPHVNNNTRPAWYAVFVLDLCVVLPALAITAFLLLRKSVAGQIYAGVALVLSFVQILSELLGELMAPHFNLPLNPAMIGVYGTVVLLSLIFGILYFSKLDLSADKKQSQGQVL